MAVGTYVECITLKDGVALYGGFVGGETALGERDWSANVTILDGKHAGSVVTTPVGAGATTRIDGFMICNGGGSSTAGGGILCMSCAPTIQNNIISGNTGSSGGGIYCDPSSCPTIVNNTISDNCARIGSGICCESSCSITGNVICANFASVRGGGIACASHCAATIANNVIAGNAGEGIYCDRYTSPLIANNTITGNSGPCDPTAGSGGIFLYSTASPRIVNTIVAFNSSGIGQFGGQGAPILECNCVYGNTAGNYAGLSDPTGMDGNISVDPRLAGQAYGNVHLQVDSPCVDAGDDAAVEDGWLDMDGHARVFGNHVDIGADEADGSTPHLGPNIIVRVSPDGDDGNDGSRWEEAKETVQAGIDVAAAEGGEVWVRIGIYEQRIVLLPHAHVYGGFAGTETTRGERDSGSHASILDGGWGGSVVTTGGYGHALSTIDGFTVRNGKGYYGGGIFCQGCSPAINNNVITLNSATFNGGGICCSYGSFPTIANNLIVGNSAEAGGGISCDQASAAVIVGDTIVGNSADAAGGIGYSSFWPGTVANTIVAFNSSGFGGTWTSASLHDNCVYGNGTYNYSGTIDPTGTEGNISEDPRFLATPTAGDDGKWGTADDDYGDLHLRYGSPCINAGDPGYVPAVDETDIDGQVRVLYGRVDMGADEFFLVGDVNDDRYVNVGDLQAVIAAWGSSLGGLNWNPKADLDGDLYVTVGDLQLLAANWGREI